MDKISITINGKTFEAKGENLFEIIDNFLSDTTKEEQHDDIPKEYMDYEEYLCLDEFNPAKCTTKEQLDDLDKKLKNRIDWIKKHPKADFANVYKDLENKKKVFLEIYNKLHYMKEAYSKVMVYIATVQPKSY